MASKDEIRQVVSQEINNQIKRFKKIMGPNTKKLLNATDKNGFATAFKKKNWLGTNPVHAAAIVSIGAVVVPEKDDIIIKNIRTLQDAKAYTSVKPIITSFPEGADDLYKFIQTYGTKDQSTFFKTIRTITRTVPDQLLDNSDSKSEQTSGKNKGGNPEPPRLSTMLANITYACDKALKDKETEIEDLFKYIRKTTDIPENGEFEPHPKYPNLKKTLDRFLTEHTKQFNINRCATILHLSHSATEGLTKKTATNKINQIFKKIQDTVEKIYDLREKQSPK